MQRAALQVDLDQSAARFVHRFLTDTGTSRALPLPIPTPSRRRPRPRPAQQIPSRVRPSPLSDTVDAIISRADRRHAVRRLTSVCLQFRHRVLLKLQSVFTRRFRQRLDAAVIPITAAIKRNRFDAKSFRLSAMRLPTAAAASMLPPYFTLLRTQARASKYWSILCRRSDRSPVHNMTIQTVHRQPHRLQFGNFAAGLPRPAYRA